MFDNNLLGKPSFMSLIFYNDFNLVQFFYSLVLFTSLTFSKRFNLIISINDIQIINEKTNIKVKFCC